MKARNLLAVLICVIVLAGLGYYSLLPREIPAQTTRSESTTHPPPERTPELKVTIIWDTLAAQFPTVTNVTSLLQNTNGGSIDSISVLQTVPSGLNLTGVYVVNASGSGSPYEPLVTSGRLSYPLNNTLAPGEKIAIVVLLESTPAAVSGNFTTIATGTYNEKSVQSQGTVWVFVKPPAATCQDWNTIEFGEFLLQNNVWGGQNEPHVQCISANQNSFGWNVTRLSPSKYGLPSDCPECIAPYYPEVIYGKNPWQTRSTTANLPAIIDSLESLEVSMAATVIPYKKYDLAFDIWITNSTESRPTDITDEVMIWLLWTPGLPAERVLDTVNDGYNAYQHRTYAYWNMTRIEGPLRWTMHEFIIKKQGIPSRINILSFLEHLRKEKRDLRYLASIELGTEVWSGIGATKFGTYRIDLKTIANTVSIAPALMHEHEIFRSVDGPAMERRSHREYEYTIVCERLQ